MEIKVNSRVRISAPVRGMVVGEILDICASENMPDIGGFDTVGEFAPRSILKEWNVSRVAHIGYQMADGQDVMFTAFEIEGEWYDLQTQPLTLEVVGPAP